MAIDTTLTTTAATAVEGRVERAAPHAVAARHAPWHGLGLAATLAVAAALNLWKITASGYANTYYAAAVKSMLLNWRNFFFVAFDPGGFVTVDKPPLGFWMQAASAKLFGFSGWSILLPEALAGVASVALVYHLVRRVWNATAGLIAAFSLAVTPISVVTNRNNTIDSLLIVALLGAAWAVTKATETGRLRWLLLAMALVGLGFNIKMLEAYLALPALLLVSFLGARHGWLKRIAHLALGVAVLLAVSLAWVVAVDLTPADQRPYVGSTQDNSELSLALGYNGLTRLLGQQRLSGDDGAPARTGAAAQTPAQPAGGQLPPGVPLPDNPGAPAGNDGGFAGGGGPGGVGETGAKGIFRLFNRQLGGQISWLLPLALVGIVAGISRQRSAVSGQPTAASEQPPADASALMPPGGRPQHAALPRAPWALNARHTSLALWGMWTVTMAAFFSIAGMFHRYYLSMLAPGIAALAGIAIAALWTAYRRRQPLGWLLPAALLGTAAVQAMMLAAYPAYARWMVPVIAGGAILAVAALVLVRVRVRRATETRWRLGHAATVVGLCALLVAPTVWSVISVQAGGNSQLPAAGPAEQDGFFGGGPPDGANHAGDAVQTPEREGQANSGLIAYLTANRGTTTYLVAVPSAMGASGIILQTGAPVMAMGGFTGSDPILTAARVAQLVKDGTVRYFLLGGFGGTGGQASASQWVTSNCAPVPADRYGASTTTTNRTGGTGGQQLYDCAAPAPQ